MNKLSFWKRLLREEDGPTAVEYAIMLALILGVVFASIGVVGTETRELYDAMSGEIQSAINSQ